MKNIVIIGAGRAGSSFARVLSGSKKFTINAIADKFLSSVDFISSLKYFGDDNIEATKYGDIIIISTPDDLIEKVAYEIREHIDNKIVFHLSGSRPSYILNCLKEKGCSVASIHPLQSMPDGETGAKNLLNAYFCIEGDKIAVHTAVDIVNEISGKYFTIDSKYKYLYHAAAVFSSNFINTTVFAAYSIFKEIGVEEENIIEILSPLFNGTINNIDRLGVIKSLTGPVIRGDVNTIKGHLKSFENFYNEFSTLYRELTYFTVKLAENSTGRDYSDILKLLSDKGRKN